MEKRKKKKKSVSYEIDRQLVTINYINNCKNGHKNSYDSRIT